MRDFNNWRGVTLLPVTSINKVFSRMFIDRIKKIIDRRLRKEQAGFRQGRGTTKQNFIFWEHSRAGKWMESTNLYTFCRLWKSIRLRPQRESLGHNEELWSPRQDHQGNKRNLCGVWMCSHRGKRNIRVIQDKDWCETGMCAVGVPLSPYHRLGYEETKVGVRRGIRWDFTTALEDLDFPY